MRLGEWEERGRREERREGRRKLGEEERKEVEEGCGGEKDMRGERRIHSIQLHSCKNIQTMKRMFWIKTMLLQHIYIFSKNNSK